MLGIMNISQQICDLIEKKSISFRKAFSIKPYVSCHKY